tara:strand:- start:261 stop:452 length:192 start_codon:yes stop_codon:yes gene_type:complete
MRPFSLRSAQFYSQAQAQGGGYTMQQHQQMQMMMQQQQVSEPKRASLEEDEQRWMKCANWLQT